MFTFPLWTSPAFLQQRHVVLYAHRKQDSCIVLPEKRTNPILNSSFQIFMFQKVKIAEIDQLWPHGRPNCTWSIIVNDLLGECSIPNPAEIPTNGRPGCSRPCGEGIGHPAIRQSSFGGWIMQQVGFIQPDPLMANQGFIPYWLKNV